MHVRGRISQGRPHMLKRLLPLIPAGLRVQHVSPAPDRVTVFTAPEPAFASCPACGRHSRRVHSRYTRTVADLPWQGRAVAVHVRARRFRCAAPACPRRIFTERLSTVAAAKARRTTRLADAQRGVGFALGGKAGARLAARLAMPTSGDTLLRLVRSAPPRTAPPPRVLLSELRRCAEIARAADAARAFVVMIRNREPAALGPWLAEAADGPLAGFAEGLRRDRAAVEAALTLPWSTGPVEGKITKLKLVKRSMYGRAGIDLLRRRLLTA